MSTKEGNGPIVVNTSAKIPFTDSVGKHSPTGSEPWTIFGRKTQQSKVVYICQIFILYAIILTCLGNLSAGTDQINLWSTLLASCIGYILPAPKLKTVKNNE